MTEASSSSSSSPLSSSPSAEAFSCYAGVDYARVLAADTSHRYSRFLEAKDDSAAFPHSTPPFVGVGPRSAAHPELGELGVLYDDEPLGGVDTMWKAWQRTVRLIPSAPCLGRRPYVLASGDGRPQEAEALADPSTQSARPAEYAMSSSDGLPLRGEYVWSSFWEVDQQAQEVGRGLSVLAGLSGADGASLTCCVVASCRPELVVTFLALRSQSIPIIALSSRMGSVACAASSTRSTVPCCSCRTTRSPAWCSLCSQTTSCPHCSTWSRTTSSQSRPCTCYRARPRASTTPRTTTCSCTPTAT